MQLITSLFLGKMDSNCDIHCNFRIIDYSYPFRFNSAIGNMKRLVNKDQSLDLKRKRFLLILFFFPWLSCISYTLLVVEMSISSFFLFFFQEPRTLLCILMVEESPWNLKLFYVKLTIYYILTDIYNVELLSLREKQCSIRKWFFFF